MSEFVLNYGSPEAARRFGALDAFTQGYLEAAFFTETGTGDDAENDLEHASLAELDNSAWEQFAADSATFQAANYDDLHLACTGGFGSGGEDYDYTRAGHDLWYSRNGHGVGYWDRDLGDLGDRLHAAARYSERTLYRGDDGRLYLS